MHHKTIIIIPRAWSGSLRLRSIGTINIQSSAGSFLLVAIIQDVSVVREANISRNVYLQAWLQIQMLGKVFKSTQMAVLGPRSLSPSDLIHVKSLLKVALSIPIHLNTSANLTQDQKIK